MILNLPNKAESMRVWNFVRLVCRAQWFPHWPCVMTNRGGHRPSQTHTSYAWSTALIDLWTNWLVPAYLSDEPSVVLSSAQWGESLGCPRSIHWKKSNSLFLFLMGTRVLSVAEGAIIAAQPNAPIRASINDHIFSFTLTLGRHHRGYLFF